MEIVIALVVLGVIGYVIYRSVNKTTPTEEAVVFPTYSAPLEPEVVTLTIAPIEAPVAPVVTVAPTVEVAELAPIAPVATPKPAAKKTVAKPAVKKAAAPKTAKTGGPKAPSKTQVK